MSANMTVEIAYAKPDEQVIISFEVPEGTPAGKAIELSGVLERFPEIDTTKNKYGIFGKACKADRVLKSGDRVEIYRPLIADPKAVRKERAAAGKVMRKGAKAESDSVDKS